MVLYKGILVEMKVGYNVNQADEERLKMSFDNKNEYKKLIRSIADMLIEFIEEMPDGNNDLLKPFENEAETKPVAYSKGKTKQKPLKIN